MSLLRTAWEKIREGFEPPNRPSGYTPGCCVHFCAGCTHPDQSHALLRLLLWELLPCSDDNATLDFSPSSLVFRGCSGLQCDIVVFENQ